MAVGIHVVRVNFLPISRVTGLPVDKGDVATTIKDVLKTEHRHVVLPDSTVPNSLNYPTVDQYLKLEALTDYVVHHMDQNMIVTYDQGTLNVAT